MKKKIYFFILILTFSKIFSQTQNINYGEINFEISSNYQILNKELLDEAKKNNATILVTPYRISRNDDVQDIIIEDPKAMLISKPKYPAVSSGIYGIYVRRLKSYLI